MYSNNKGFSIVDILIKIVFFIVFIFVLIYLFPQISDLNPFYNNIFRENLKYMQDAAEDYFNNNLPVELGDTNKLTLKQMIERNLLIPFVDKDNNSCNLYKSYAEITKTKDGYKLRINLVCNGESDYIEKILGCNNYCDGVNCKNLKDACTDCEETPKTKTCTETKNITYYQFEKENTVFSTSYYCEEGYSLKDKKCYRTVQSGREKAIAIYDESKTKIEPAQVIPGKTYYEYVDYVVTETVEKIAENKKVLVNPIMNYVPGGSYEKPYSCTLYRDEEKCETKYVTREYDCDCKSVISGGKVITVCGTCTETVPVRTCETISVPYTGTCYETVETPGYYEYSCPAGTDYQIGTGKNLKCYNYETTYRYETIKSYSCPLGVDGSSGSNENLKCYYIKKTPDTFKCTNSKAVRVGNQCYITESGAFLGYKCKTSEYILDGDYCYLEKTEETDAKSNITSSTEWLQQWSTSPYIEGWRRIGIKVVSTVVTVPCK